MADKKRILVIEDEKPMAKALALKLTKANFEVENAFNGEDAMTALQGGSFDLIVSDLVMPKMNGFEVLEHLKAEGKDTPVMILSNLSQDEDREKVLALGAKEFFIKSDIPIADVVEKVTALLK